MEREREKEKHIGVGITEHRRCEGERANNGEGGLRGDRRRVWELLILKIFKGTVWKHTVL